MPVSSSSRSSGQAFYLSPLLEIFFAFIRVHSRLFFALFVPLADVAKGGDGAKSAFCGYS
jgi:hypothetical protein